ncbi:MAG TPA: LiaF domain-containing protein [Actinomycetota bacterium]
MTGLPAPPPSPPTRRQGFQPGRLLFGLIVVAVGMGWLLQAFDVTEVPWDVILPSVLILIGVVLVATAGWGGGQGGLITLGIVLTVVLLAGTVVDVPFRGGVGDRTYTPVTATGRTYELAVGNLTLDLTDSGLPTPVPSRIGIEAHVGVGQLLVIVPASFVSVDVHAKAGIGQTNVFGRTQSGFGVDYRSQGTNDSAPLLHLELSVGIGQVEVRRV